MHVTSQDGRCLVVDHVMRLMYLRTGPLVPETHQAGKVVSAVIILVFHLVAIADSIDRLSMVVT